ncbi:hypothetical protein FOA52_008826 [Chlamydomonas sp. UWO 241]|nr:hypothetical protein FOA52_008826 [Chlamydomonas sp. UWO 241]
MHHIEIPTKFKRKDVRKVVRTLGAYARPAEQKQALQMLAALCLSGSGLSGEGIASWRAAISEAGAIPVLVPLPTRAPTAQDATTQCHVSGLNSVTVETESRGAASVALSSEAPVANQMQHNATVVLSCLAEILANVAVLVAAGVIPHMVPLLRPGAASDAVQLMVVETLNILGQIPGCAISIVAAGAVPHLVRLLTPASPSAENIQAVAAAVLLHLAHYADSAMATVAAGAIPPLVQMLRPGALPEVQDQSIAFLGHLLEELPPTAVCVSAAGGIPLLVLVLRPSTLPDVRFNATYSLSRIALFPNYAYTIASTRAVPALVQMLGRSDSGLQTIAAELLVNLACMARSAGVAPAILAAGGVPPLVQLLRPGCSVIEHFHAAIALTNIADSASNKDTIKAAGAVPLLEQLLAEPGANVGVVRAASELLEPLNTFFRF